MLTAALLTGCGNTTNITEPFQGNTDVTASTKLDENGNAVPVDVQQNDDITEPNGENSTGGVIETFMLSFYNITVEIGKPISPTVAYKPPNISHEQKLLAWASSDWNIATVSESGCITGVSCGQCSITAISLANPELSATVTVNVIEAKAAVPTEEATQQTTDIIISKKIEPTYIQGVLIVNKTYPLPADYGSGLDPTANAQFKLLVKAAAEEGLNIYNSSAYRSYEHQKNTYEKNVKNYGKATADTFSARPGHSEHQTGLAIDVNTINDAFAKTDESKWLKDHAHEFGFIIRYPEGKSDITGYKYEPWHIRYLGVDWATKIYESGLTLEEYFGIDSVYTD